MDTDFLYALQNLREGTPDILSGFLSLLSLIADGPGLVAIVMVVYWCVSKRAGQFTIAAFMMGNLASQFIKNLACVYRPWIRDPRITPPEYVMEGAGGYSFPSGHATGATTSLGSFAWLLRKTHLVWSVVLIVIVVLIVFSRNFLGVHTPQDVLVAVGIGVLTIWLISRFFRWFEENEDKDVLVAVVAIAVSLITLIIVIVKPYPLDYVDGKLLVDPLEMQKGSFEASGVVIGVVLGWLFERRMVRFSTDTADIDPRGRIIRGVVGVVIVGIVYLAGNALFKAILGMLWGKLVAMIVLTFVAMFVVPFVFTWLEQTRFVPYAGVAVPPRSGSSRSARLAGGEQDLDRSSRQSSGRSSAGRTSSGRTSRNVDDRSRNRSSSSQRPRKTKSRPTRRSLNDSPSSQRSSRGPARDADPRREFADVRQPSQEPVQLPTQDMQEPMQTQPSQRSAALAGLPSIEQSPAPAPEIGQYVEAQGYNRDAVNSAAGTLSERPMPSSASDVDTYVDPSASSASRPRLDRIDIPSPRDDA